MNLKSFVSGIAKAFKSTNKPCAICTGVHICEDHMAKLANRHIQRSRAIECIECRSIFESPSVKCPSCGSYGMPLDLAINTRALEAKIADNIKAKVANFGARLRRG